MRNISNTERTEVITAEKPFMNQVELPDGTVQTDGTFGGGVVKNEQYTRFVTTQDGVTVDLKPTIDRIDSGGKFPHRNDGSVFMNKEGLLPNQALGYYHEYVNPTPGIKGPGPQRIVTGQGGEMWFTLNYY